MRVTAIILAGGKSSSMGRDKGLSEYGGMPLIDYSISACKIITYEILNITRNPHLLINCGTVKNIWNTHFRPETKRVILTSDEVFKNNRISVRFINHKFEPDA
jgi:hypothetical protein